MRPIRRRCSSSHSAAFKIFVNSWQFFCLIDAFVQSMPPATLRRPSWEVSALSLSDLSLKHQSRVLKARPLGAKSLCFRGRQESAKRIRPIGSRELALVIFINQQRGTSNWLMTLALLSLRKLSSPKRSKLCNDSCVLRSRTAEAVKISFRRGLAHSQILHGTTPLL